MALVVPWKCGSILLWDITCPDIYVPSHLALAGSVAAEAEYLKRTKYQELDSVYLFVLQAIDTSRAFGPTAAAFSGQTVRRPVRGTQVYSLLQRVSVEVQRGNAAVILETLSWIICIVYLLVGFCYYFVVIVAFFIF